MPIPSTDKSSPVYRSPTIIPSTRVSSLTTLVNVATQRPVRDHVAHARIMAIGRNQIRHLEGNDTIRYDTSPRARRGSLRSTSSPGLHRETSRPGPVPSTCPSPPLSSSLSLSLCRRVHFVFATARHQSCFQRKPDENIASG